MSQQELPPSDEDQTPVKKKSRFKFFMLLASIILLLGGVGGGGYWWFFAKPGAAGLPFFSGDESAGMGANTMPSADGTMGTTDSMGTTGQGMTKNADGTMANNTTAGGNMPSTGATMHLKPVPLPSLTVNLSDPPGNRSLRLGMDVEVTTPEAARALTERSSRVRDSLILIIAGKTVKELISLEGKVILKNDVAARLNQILGAPQVIRIFFTEFTIR